MFAVSQSIAAAAAQTESRTALAHATRTLHRPLIAGDYSLLQYRKSVYIAAADLQSGLNNFIGQLGTLPVPFTPPGVVPPLTVPPIVLPNGNFLFRASGTVNAPELIASAPLFTGGRIEGLQMLLESGAAAAAADEQQVRESLQTQLVTAYFGLQFANVAATNADRARSDLTEHLKNALRSRARGVANSLFVLHARAALATSYSAATAARRGAEDAQLILGQLVQVNGSIAPSTPLFVNTGRLPPFDQFLASGLAGGQTIRQTQIQQRTADALKTLAHAEFLPQILGVGQYAFNLQHTGPLQPDYVFGIVTQFTFLDPIEREQLVKSAQASRASADAAKLAAQRTLQETMHQEYDAVLNARDSYAACGASVDAAREDVRSQYANLQQGRALPVDVADARLRLATAQTDCARYAYTYDVALAQLLQSAGQPQSIDEYARTADVLVK